MSSFKEIQEKFKESIEKKNKALPGIIPVLCLAPIKFELVNNEYHIFLMMQGGGVILSLEHISSSEENIKKFIREKLSIILPVKETNILKLSKIDVMAYVFDGSKLNIDMINHLNKLNENKGSDYEWCNINLEINTSSVAPELKKVLTEEIANGRIFE